MKKKWVVIFLLLSVKIAVTQTITVSGPIGSERFGLATILKNGNYIVRDTLYDDGALVDVGAVFLYDGKTHNLISTLKGTTAGDRIGSTGLVQISNGNVLIRSKFFDNGSIVDAGAITFINAVTGLNGNANSSNSLVGSSNYDYIGQSTIYSFENSVVVLNVNWNNGAVNNAGALTWIDGINGLSGTVSSANSMVGSATDDLLGLSNIVLQNNNIVFLSTNWNNGAVSNAGACFLINTSSGSSGVIGSTNSIIGQVTNDMQTASLLNITGTNKYALLAPNMDIGAAVNAGAVSIVNNGNILGSLNASNSLVGGTSSDRIGSNGLIVLSNGNFVIFNRDYDNGSAFDVGAATWINGTTPNTGVVSSSNSLIGSTSGDGYGFYILNLPNGNYIVSSTTWDNGAIVNAGAAVWCDGTIGRSGTISTANSLYGASANNSVGNGVMILTNGNYVVSSPYWDNGSISNVGAVTWCDGTTGLVGAVSGINSLIGSTEDDNVGSNTSALMNGNYIVSSSSWDNGTIVDAGAVTWCNGATGTTGLVGTSNSLYGTSSHDLIGSEYPITLNNGHYVIKSIFWDNGTSTNAGAVTWCNGNVGLVGAVSASNSIVGSKTNDWVGSNGLNSTITQIPNNNLLIGSVFCDNGTIVDAGAVTWMNGATGKTGVVSTTNSIMGTSVNDYVGNYTSMNYLNDTIYYVISNNFDNGSIADASALTWGNNLTGTSGTISATNSLLGTTTNDNIGNFGFYTLSNGNKISVNGQWDNGSSVDAGAITFLDPNNLPTGIITPGNSIIGSSNSDQLAGVHVLNNGNFIVRSMLWNNGSITDAGVVSWCNGKKGKFGPLNSSNSIVGSTTTDNISSTGLTALNNSNYSFVSPNWDNGSVVNAGAVTFGNGNMELTGAINSCNSVLGNLASGGNNFSRSHNEIYDYFIVSKSNENRIYIYYPDGQNLAQHLDNRTVIVTGNVGQKIPIINNDCRIITTITPLSGVPIDDTITAKVWVEATQPSTTGSLFVKRHYVITPSSNATTVSGRVTLYFTQQEFDDFNAVSAADLPAGPTDNSGKANLIVEKRSGIGDANGTLSSFSGPATNIFVEDTAIIWNHILNRWEVTFDVTGFSGFWVKTIADYLNENNFYLHAVATDNFNLLQWQFSNINDIKYFEIEYSFDGINFTFLTRKENNRNITDLSFKDFINRNSQQIFYRIKAVSIQDVALYSNIKLLKSNEKNTVKIWPNPTGNELQVTLSSAKVNNFACIYNMHGQIVLQKSVSLGVNSIDVSSFKSGVYYIKINNEVLKFLKN